MGAEERLKELGLVLPKSRSSVGSYIRTIRLENTMYISGTGSRTGDAGVYGKIGKDVSIEEGYRAAELCGLSVLATIREALGSLDRVSQIVKVVGFVNAIDGFENQPKVLDGASDLFIKIFEERGRHARSAVGVSSLPFNLSVEIDVIIGCY